MDPRTDDELMLIANAFTLRVRRIESHSLMAHEATLSHLAGSGFVLRRKDGVASIERRLPNEEVLESLAARVRPLTLEQDPVYYAKAIKALTAYLHREGHPDHAEWFKKMRAVFASVDPRSAKATYFLSVEQEGGVPEESTDAALALAWFYGDLVHADAEHVLAGAAFGIDQRFAAAAVRTAQLALLARDTLSYMRFLVAEDVLPEAATAADGVEVTVQSKQLELTGVFLGEAGAKIAPGQDPLAAGLEDVLNQEGEPDGSWSLAIPWGEDA
jgi:hypothetical protein